MILEHCLGTVGITEDHIVNLHELMTTTCQHKYIQPNKRCNQSQTSSLGLCSTPISFDSKDLNKAIKHPHYKMPTLEEIPYKFSEAT